MRRAAVVVGGGPAGAVTAGLLARAGVQVALLEAARHPRRKPCGECVNPGAVAALRRLGLWEAVAPLQPVTITGWRLCAGRHLHDAAFPGDRTGLALERSRLDHALLQWAAAQGVHIYEGTKVTGLRMDGDRVTGVITANGLVEARLLIGADGLRSVVQRRLGLQAPERATAPKVAFTAHWEGVTDPDHPDRGELHFHGHLVCGIAPVGQGRANVTLVLPGPTARGLKPTDQARLLRAWPRLADRYRQGQPLEPPQATGPFDQPARAVAAPGALLVGDAAGYYDPLTGQGIYRALRTAELAADAACTALADPAAEPAAWAAYQRRLRAEFSPAVRVQRLLDALIRRPALLGTGLGLLNLLPPIGRWLIGLVGDCYHQEGADDHAEPRTGPFHADL